MTQIADEIPEVYPWDRVEPFIPALSGSLIVVSETPVETFDHEQPDADAPYRVVGIRVGELSLHTGLSGGDSEIIAVADRLIEALQDIRSAALLRLRESAR